MAVRVGILYDFPVLYFVLYTGNQRMSLIHTLKVSDYHAKVSNLWLFHLCARHICCGIPHCTYTLMISEHNAFAVIPIRKEA